MKQKLKKKSYKLTRLVELIRHGGVKKRGEKFHNFFLFKGKKWSSEKNKIKKKKFNEEFIFKLKDN